MATEKVLVAEDEPVVLMALRRLLEWQGFSVSYSANGRLQVTAQIKGQASKMTTTFKRENCLGDEQLQMWAKRVAGPRA